MKHLIHALIFLLLIHASIHAELKPRLGILPATGFDISGKKLYLLDQSIQLASNQTNYFHVISRDEAKIMRNAKGVVTQPKCLSKTCFQEAGKNLNASLIIAIHVRPFQELEEVSFLLYDVEKAKILNQVFFHSNLDSSLQTLAISRAAIQEFFGYTSSQFDSLPKPSTPPAKSMWQWPLSAGLTTLAALGFSWNQGQLFGKDDNPNSSDFVETKITNPLSGIRGLFASRIPLARFRSLGGAGIAFVHGAASPLLNPAGLPSGKNRDILFSRSNLPGNIPQIYAGFSSRLATNLFQAHAIYFEGDDLESETIFLSSVASDLALFSPYITSLKLGLTLKLYLASFGKDGTGIDRSTGHSLGWGIDFGSVWAVSSKLHFALVLKDGINYLNHTNTLRNVSYQENIPPILTIGSSYHVSRNFVLVLDGKKGLYADQTDAISLGIEKKIFKVLFLRTGLYQIYTNEPIQIWNFGFGLQHSNNGKELSVNYNYGLGIETAEFLAGQHTFSLGFGF